MNPLKIYSKDKNFIWLLLLLLFTGWNTHGQKVRFTDTANRWVTYYSNFGDNGFDNKYWQYFYEDTPVEIHGIIYQLMNMRINGFEFPPSSGVLVREDTASRKVYFKKPGASRTDIGLGINLTDTAEFVAYDFNLNVGDTFLMPLTYGLSGESMHILVEKDSLLIDGVYHIVQRLKCPMGFNGSLNEYLTVEGIGSLTDPVTPGPWINFENTENLSCFSNGSTTTPSNVTLPFGDPSRNGFNIATVCNLMGIADDIAFKNAWSISPNPSPGDITIDFVERPSGPTIITIRSLSGRLIYSASVSDRHVVPTKLWSNGMYFAMLSNKKGQYDVKKLVIQR